MERKYLGATVNHVLSSMAKHSYSRFNRHFLALFAAKLHILTLAISQQGGRADVTDDVWGWYGALVGMLYQVSMAHSWYEWNRLTLTDSRTADFNQTWLRSPGTSNHPHPPAAVVSTVVSMAPDPCQNPIGLCQAGCYEWLEYSGSGVTMSWPLSITNCSFGCRTRVETGEGIYHATEVAPHYISTLFRELLAKLWSRNINRLDFPVGTLTHGLL